LTRRSSSARATSQNTNQRTCGGLKEFISTNVTADTGGLTESDWQSFLKSAFRYGSERKVAFCSPTAIAAIEAFTRSTSTGLITNSPAQNATYGVKMSTYVSGQGTVDLVKKRDWNDSTTYGGYVFLVDMNAVKMRPLRETRLKMNVQAPDYDGFKDEYITEVSAPGHSRASSRPAYGRLVGRVVHRWQAPSGACCHLPT
jgi:hypothetical protein